MMWKERTTQGSRMLAMTVTETVVTAHLKILLREMGEGTPVLCAAKS